MMPAIYGNSYEIVQGPGYVAIQYEMVNELRVIPLDGRPHVGSAIRAYMGDARGHFEGDTLVIETTNFTDKVPYRGSSQNLRLDRALHAARHWHRRMVGDVRRPGHLDASVDLCDEPHQDDRASVRVRLPRGELRDAEHARHREARGGRGLRGADGVSTSNSQGANSQPDRAMGRIGSRPSTSLRATLSIVEGLEVGSWELEIGS